MKRIEGQIKKRWAVVSKKREYYHYTCHVTEEQCIQRYDRVRKCKQVYKIDHRTGRPGYENECNYENVPKNECSRLLKLEDNMNYYDLYKHDFTNSWNKTEVETMFASVQRQIASRLHF